MSYLFICHLFFCYFGIAKQPTLTVTYIDKKKLIYAVLD